MTERGADTDEARRKRVYADVRVLPGLCKDLQGNGRKSVRSVRRTMTESKRNRKRIVRQGCV